jgi:hypothetical protein
MVRTRTLVAYAAAIVRSRSSSFVRRVLPGLALGGAVVLAAPVALAGPGDGAAVKGLSLARRGDCVKAVPFLEEAELARHRPANAIPLADCYVALGDLTHAAELYHVVQAEKPARFWVRTDYNAQKSSASKAADLDARIPTVQFEPDDDYDDLEIEVGGHVLADPTEPKQLQPDVSIPIVMRAKGYRDRSDKIVLNERERRKILVHLEPIAAKKPRAPADPVGSTWIGARYRGVVIPKFIMNTVAEGGRSLAVPGGGITLTVPTSSLDVTISIGYLSYRMANAPFKPSGTPDTEWELISSDLQALTASVDLMWRFPLDAGKVWTFRLGGGVGAGWTFLGDLYRTQAYPANGKEGDPYTYLPCKGPNNPKGTFRYCNTLDKDASRYPGYTEPNWFNHGIRPLIFPWAVLPEIGLTWKPTPRFAVDLETGISISGLLTSLGIRFAL